MPASRQPKQALETALNRIRQARSRYKRDDWATLTILAALFGVILVCVLIALVFVGIAAQPRAVIPTAANISQPDAESTSSFEPSVTVREGERLTLADGRTIILQAWDSISRLTVLFIGVDRPSGAVEALMIASFDPNNQRLGLLGIPLDVEVDIPRHDGLYPIQQALELGEARLPGSGIRTLMDTAQNNFGIPIPHYLVLDYAAFGALTDLLGGVSVTVPMAINDANLPPTEGETSILNLAEGIQTLTGDQAVMYARTRFDGSEVQRAFRQQQIVLGLHQRLINANDLRALIVTAPTLLTQWRDQLVTSLTLDQLIQLGWYLKDLPADAVRARVVEGVYLLRVETGGSPQTVLRRARIGELMTQVFGATYAQ